jgi:hypothetical protein
MRCRINEFCKGLEEFILKYFKLFCVGILSNQKKKIPMPMY